MLSVLGDQPLHLGLGRGTAKFEFDAFSLDMEESRQRFQECWEILQLAMTGEPFTYTGGMYSVPREVRVRPRPARDRVHFYGAIGSPSSAEIMGRLRPAARSAPRSGTWRCRPPRSRTGRRPRPSAAWTPRTSRCPILVNCIVAPTDEQAVDEAKEFMPRYMQAQVDHYQVDVTPWENVKSYEAWRRIFDGTVVADEPREHPAVDAVAADRVTRDRRREDAAVRGRRLQPLHPALRHARRSAGRAHALGDDVRPGGRAGLRAGSPARVELRPPCGSAGRPAARRSRSGRRTRRATG